ncbi:hypothetical protein CA265_02520 [Sphingobacteriaceae bacterium GW460-11-11-14-LB5]|nr:hypothetical protein CA265_02520 [Sphingobacteriaceae bacterium GW460-11-11-14-LB5]
MKKYIIYIPVFLLIAIVAVSSCKNNNYYIDSGVGKAQYEGTILTYLADKPAYFDTLSRVITLAGMQDVFSRDTITFFAPPSSCIYKAVKNLNKYLYGRGQDTVKQLNQIDPKVWKDMLSLYIVKGKYLLKDIPQLDTTQLSTFGGQGYISNGGRPMNIGVLYNDVNGVKYAGYRQLYYSYITDFTNKIGSMVNVPVASSDIQPYNGVVHVLVYQRHVFGFQTNNFILQAIAAGIKPPL